MRILARDPKYRSNVFVLKGGFRIMLVALYYDFLFCLRFRVLAKFIFSLLLHICICWICIVLITLQYLRILCSCPVLDLIVGFV